MQSTLVQTSLPPSQDSSWHAKDGACKAAGRFHHLQDIRHRMMQSQWQRQKQCQIHSLLTIVWQQPPQHTPPCTFLIPSTYQPPCCRPGFTRCNLSTAAAAKWARPLKYLIGFSSSPITTLQGVWSQTSLSGLSHNTVQVIKKLHFLPPAPIRPPYVCLHASNYNKCKVWISRKLAWLQMNMQDQVQWWCSCWSQRVYTSNECWALVWKFKCEHAVFRNSMCGLKSPSTGF